MARNLSGVARKSGSKGVYLDAREALRCVVKLRFFSTELAVFSVSHSGIQPIQPLVCEERDARERACPTGLWGVRRRPEHLSLSRVLEVFVRVAWGS